MIIQTKERIGDKIIVIFARIQKLEYNKLDKKINYFTAKVFKAIETFSNKLNLDYYILIDNNSWNL